MSLKDTIEVNPIKTAAAVLSFGTAVITAIAFNQHWTGEAVGLIQSTWTAFMAVVGTLFVQSKTTNNSDLDQIVETIVPVAESALVDPPHPAE